MSLEDELKFPEEELQELMKGIREDIEPLPVGDPGSMLRILVDLEVAALKLARDEIRRDGMIPSMTAGRVIWFELAKAISGYLQKRIGMPADSGAGGGA